MYVFAADLVVLLHFLFIVFVIAGGLLALKWRWVTWLHIPAAIWSAFIEFSGWVCPLTPLENVLRRAGEGGGYTTSFIGHYLVPIIYPAGLTRETQFIMGVAVILINVMIYYRIYRARQ